MKTLNNITEINEIDDNKLSITLNTKKVITRNIRISNNDDSTYILFFGRELSLKSITDYLG